MIGIPFREDIGQHFTCLHPLSLSTSTQNGFQEGKGVTFLVRAYDVVCVAQYLYFFSTELLERLPGQLKREQHSLNPLRSWLNTSRLVDS